MLHILMLTVLFITTLAPLLSALFYHSVRFGDVKESKVTISNTSQPSMRSLTVKDKVYILPHSTP